MRIVLDTNTVVSALLWKGAPHVLLTTARERPDITLFSSPKLLAELADVLSRVKLASAVRQSGRVAEALMHRYLGIVRVVLPDSVPAVVLADPDDDHVLACALLARADFIVSGDNDLLALDSYQGIPIVSAGSAVQRIAA